MTLCIGSDLPNRSLAQVLQIERILTVEQTIELLVALLRSRINSSEIHGQITPDRVLIVSEHPVHLQILPGDNLHADPEFSAPEVLNAKINQSSDIYSIGLIAIYLLTGIRPFQLFDPTNNCWIWQEYWHRLPSDNSKLAAILDRAIDLDADLRFSSAREMLAAIHDCYPIAPIPPNWYCRQILTGHHGLFAAIKSIAISPHLPIVATGSEDKTIRLWDIHTGAQIGILTGHQKSVETLVFHPHQSGLLYSSGQDGIIKLWQVETESELISLNSQQNKVNSLAINPDGILISGGSDRTIKIWELGSNDPRQLKPLTTLKAHQLSVNSLAFNPISSDLKFASVSSDRRVILWDLEGQTPLSILTAHTQAVRSLAFSSDGKFLATAGDDGLIQIWDTNSHKLTQTLSAHRWTISALSFLADGNTLISASWDGNIKFWQVSTWQEIECLSTHSAEVLAMDIGDRGKCIITGSRDRTAKIWQQI